MMTPRRAQRTLRAPAEKPSQRPTLIPDFDLEAFARAEGLPVVRSAQTPGDSGIRSRDEDPYRELKRLIAGDHLEAALTLAEALREERPSDIEAEYFVEDCRLALVEIFETRLGSVDRVPARIVGDQELKALAIDPLIAFLLSNVDGVSTLDMILDVSGMSRLDALRLLHRMVREKLIELR